MQKYYKRFVEEQKLGLLCCKKNSETHAAYCYCNFHELFKESSYIGAGTAAQRIKALAYSASTPWVPVCSPGCYTSDPASC